MISSLYMYGNGALLFSSAMGDGIPYLRIFLELQSARDMMGPSPT